MRAPQIRSKGTVASMIGLGIFLFSFLISYVGTGLLLKTRLRGRFVDVPNERSSHDVVKPRFGGIAIFAAFFLTFVVLLSTQRGMTGFVPLLIGGLLVFSVGLLDDRRSLPVWSRFGAQIVAAGILVVTGNVVDHVYLPLVGTIDLDMLAVPFTVLFVMASINFFNFIDGIDGLAAGSAFIVSSFLALIAYMLGHTALALMCLALAGSTVGFLQFNFPPSRLFMGDGGSTFLGFFFAFVAISGNRLTPEIPFFIPALLLSSLYLDAGLTLVRRAFRGEKIFRPHHTHYYQRLLSLGLNHKQVTMLEYALTTLLGISALVFFKAGGFFPVFVCLCWLVIFTSLILKIRSLERGDRMFWERRTLLVVGSDVLVIALAYFAAFFIRMNFQKTDPHWDAVLRAFPIVLVVRSSCFYWYGLYRGVWKYTSTPDVLRIIKAITMGSAIILMLLVFFYRFVAFPRSMFIIEYFLLIAAIGGTRFASRLFHEYGKEAMAGNAKRVAIIGAGDDGERLLREIRSTDGRRVSVVCFIDDDKEKDGLTLQGVPITGPLDRLGEICGCYSVDSVVLGTADPPPPAATLEFIVREAGEAGVQVETRGGAYVDSPVPAAVLYDRLARRLGRAVPSRPSESSRSFYDGKRVLVTHGGEAIGPVLVGDLLGLGAEVTVHVDSPREAGHFARNERGPARFLVGDMDRETDAARLLDASSPQVVFHAIRLRAEEMANEADFIWQRVVRASNVLCNGLERSPVESLVFVFFWEGTRNDSCWASVGAVAEALALNNPDLLGSSPKVVRLPAVLTEAELRRIMNGTGRSGPGGRRFGIVENEASALVLNTGAAYKGRAIVIPRAEPAFGSQDIEALTDGETAAEAVPLGRPLFPTEATKPSFVPGADEVVSPIYPASEYLAGTVSDCVRFSGSKNLEACLQALSPELFDRANASRSVRSSIE